MFHEKVNSIQSIYCVNLVTPDLTKTSNVKNFTGMASKSDKFCNLDFQAESPQTIPHNSNDNFLYMYY